MKTDEYTIFLEQKLKWYYDYVDYVINNSIRCANAAMISADKLEQERTNKKESK